jgi:putative transposase
VIEVAFTELTEGGLASARAACQLLGKPRSSHYRRLRPAPPGQLNDGQTGDRNSDAPDGGQDGGHEGRQSRRRPSNALSDAERARVLDLLRGGRFVDKAPAQVWATLLDEGVYLCSESTMYRLLRAHGEVRERRRHARHPAKVKPELVAYRPNEVWSWDITKLPGPARGVHYDLYVMLDIYSRYVVGWQVAVTETGELAEDLIADTIARLGATPHTIHADRGSSMTSKPVSVLLADLGITRSHSRPRVSDDNPFSEAQFRTLKYCPAFPERFGSLADARAFCEQFFTHYNHVHRHSGIGLHTPASVHFGTADQIRAHRARTLADAHTAHPNRFRKPPRPPALPGAAWINQPAIQTV